MRILFLIFFLIYSSVSYSQNPGPGYQFDLFRNTASWKLAQAVEREDLQEIIKILKDKSVDINLQEPVFGSTVLHLAIGNDKLISTKALLDNNANFNIVNVDKRSAIHEAVNDIKSRKNSYAILELLIKHGANVNAIRESTSGKLDTLGYSVPLKDAISDLACTKLLLANGANLYFKTSTTYPIWFFMLLMGDIDDNIFVVKYIIVDKQMPIPNPISYTVDKKQLDILLLLNDLNLSEDPKRLLAKQEIIAYLRKIDFPKNGTYQ
jgi:ankyrin repeat protein